MNISRLKYHLSVKYKQKKTVLPFMFREGRKELQPMGFNADPNLRVLVASLSDINEENERGVRARKNLQGVTDRISQTVWVFTYFSDEKISFRLFVLIKCQNVLLFVRPSFLF